MKDFIIKDSWSVVEEGFHATYNEYVESLCALGNGRMGQRGNFEEYYSGHTLQGNYVAGVYYPDKTRVGWWKNGYPEYFAKVLNAANWIGIDIHIAGQRLDLNQCDIQEFRRELNMKQGFLQRKVKFANKAGHVLEIETKRINSIVDDEAGVIHYQLKSINFAGSIKIGAFIDGDIANKDSNYDEKFWNAVNHKAELNTSFLTLETKKTAFHVCTAQLVTVFVNDLEKTNFITGNSTEKFVSNNLEVNVEEGDTVTIIKYAINLSSENYKKENLIEKAQKYLEKISLKGAINMFAEQALAWETKWEQNDIIIEGDVAAQQGIRFNIFHLNQTYTGQDARLNIGPKGFTGEKYGGVTYWDTEAYCIPFYLSTADTQVARNLLIYRWKHLDKAIENAEKLGFTKGAALYPMVTMNGEECHNEWEITFEEIHRNGAIAYAIFDYIRYTGDFSYMAEYGLEVLMGIARFWVQRVHWSVDKQAYVMLGVTGPNEYENNINNNWYTNYIARWCISYFVENYKTLVINSLEVISALNTKRNFDSELEIAEMIKIASNIYLPESKELGIYLQQDGFLDKEQVTVADLKATDRPLNQNWSWDRILRSPFIKQADVLQGLYFFENEFDLETIRRNYDYYEPKTVHESSLSPCVHSILAAKLGKYDHSYAFYQRAARLDLDDYNNDTEDGLHITSMAGTWMSVVKGFGGLEVINNELHIAPFLPNEWKSFCFKIKFRDRNLEITVSKNNTIIKLIAGNELSIVINKIPYLIKDESNILH